VAADLSPLVAGMRDAPLGRHNSTRGWGGKKSMQVGMQPPSSYTHGQHKPTPRGPMAPQPFNPYFQQQGVPRPQPTAAHTNSPNRPNVGANKRYDYGAVPPQVGSMRPQGPTLHVLHHKVASKGHTLYVYL
jgi:hypothetical protein